MLEFQAGEVKKLNVALTPTAAQPINIAIDQLFIGTRKRSYETGADCRIYVRLANMGAGEVSGRVHIYDWQAWWGHTPGDERHWTSAVFTMPPGGVFRFATTIHELAFDTTYIRIEAVVNDIKVAETPRVYFIPGKMYTGPEKIAQGQCTYKAPGLAVLWYSQYSECKVWDGFYHTPQTRPYLHSGDFEFRTSNYDNKWWPAIFCIILDAGLIPGSLYQAYISGGGAGAAWREVWFNFTA